MHASCHDGRTSPRGWLQVQDDEGENGRRWVALDNGVLWIRRSPEDTAIEGSLPLMNAVIEKAWRDGGVALTVRMRGSDREFRLRASSEEELAEWEWSMMEAKRIWIEKRRASALYRASHATYEHTLNSTTSKNYDGGRGNMESVAPRPSPRANRRPPCTDEEIYHPGCHAMAPSCEPVNRTLREIVASDSSGAPLPSWSSLPEVVRSGLSESLGNAGAEPAFRLAASEAAYNDELSDLCRLGMRIVVQWADDPCPAFLRRSLVAHIKRMKLLSDGLLVQLESLWAKRPSLIGVHGIYARVIPEFRAPYTAYCGNLEEAKLIIQRALEVRADGIWAASGKRRRELVLVPLQRLTTLRILLQLAISGEGGLPANEVADTEKALKTLKEILDECYAEMTAQSGAQFVAEVDNLLDFDDMSSGTNPLSLLMTATQNHASQIDNEEHDDPFSNT